MNPASAPALADAFESSAPVPTPTRAGVAPESGWPVAILGVPFDPVTIVETIDRIDAMVASRRCHYIVTANVDFLVQARQDVELRRILLDADLVLCDGMPVLWASRWLGNPLPERVAGSDLAPALMASAADKGHRLFFLGAGPGVAAAAAARLQQQYPALEIAGTYAPPFSPLLDMDNDEIVRRVRAARPDILLVCFGCPKQEKWIAMHHRSLGVPVVIGVGATLDFLAGRVQRAPAWMRRSGTEWLYRLAREPRRLVRRYGADLVGFIPTLARQWWQLTSHDITPSYARAGGGVSGEWCNIDGGTQLTRHSLEQDAGFWREVRRRDAHCVFDASHLRRIDGTGVAFLIRWRKDLEAIGRHLVLVAPSVPLRRVFATLRLSDYLNIATTLADAEAMKGSGRLVACVPCPNGTTRSLSWCGEIIAANCEEVWRMTTEHVRNFVSDDATLIMIDLSQLRFIDSSGAALMLRLKKWSRTLQTEVLFARAQPNVQNVLRLTRLEQTLLEGSQ